MPERDSGTGGDVCVRGPISNLHVAPHFLRPNSASAWGHPYPYQTTHRCKINAYFTNQAVVCLKPRPPVGHVGLISRKSVVKY